MAYGQRFPRCVSACISRDYSIRSVHAKESQEINMEMDRKTFGLLMLLVIILASRDKVVMKVEGRVCESQSHRFKGPCTADWTTKFVKLQITAFESSNVARGGVATNRRIRRSRIDVENDDDDKEEENEEEEEEDMSIQPSSKKPRKSR
ncbi:hypothetical protein Vadar_008503 [Vaccinium darrowii]|uniref:Uncharacterized protein n=1 Tax=Vaccinium darrowii TaxID=229202 RepID=A0ACB7YCE6_9ERIC|nr:hypothetical protein Vadar_008503 [Vaccinium darrowii]